MSLAKIAPGLVGAAGRPDCLAGAVRARVLTYHFRRLASLASEKPALLI